MQTVKVHLMRFQRKTDPTDKWEVDNKAIKSY